jgi:hypothetical protein
MRCWWNRVTAVTVMSVAGLLAGPEPAAAQDFDQASCDEFLLPLREVRSAAGSTGRATPVGPASCLMQETDITLGDRTLRRLDIGLDGTVEGYLTKTGDYKEYRRTPRRSSSSSRRTPDRSSSPSPSTSATRAPR